MDYNKWLKHTFSSGASTGKDYIEFQKRMKFDLKKMAQENRLEIHSFSKNHYEFSAVLKDSQEDRFIYVGISDVRFFVNDWYKNVLIRTMKHDKDWTGGSNHFCCWKEVGVTARQLIEFMKRKDNQEKQKEELELEM